MVINKLRLEQFIAKYHLGGLVDSVKIKSDGHTLTTSFSSTDRNIHGFVQMAELPFDPGEYCVFDTKRFLSLLSVLDGDTIDIEIIKQGSQPSILRMSSLTSPVVSTMFLANPVNIPKSPKFTEQIAFGASHPVDDKFIDRILKARAALNTDDSFQLSPNTLPGISFTFGEKKADSVRFDLVVPDHTLKITHRYSALYLKDIMRLHKKNSGTFSCNDNPGLIEFVFDGGATKYYLVALEST
jgi:hypothetical protein